MYIVQMFSHPLRYVTANHAGSIFKYVQKLTTSPQASPESQQQPPTRPLPPCPLQFILPKSTSNQLILPLVCLIGSSNLTFKTCSYSLGPSCSKRKHSPPCCPKQKPGNDPSLLLHPHQVPNIS